MDGPPSTPLLLMTLEVAVPLWIQRWRGRSWVERLVRSAECAEIVAAKGDVLQYGGGPREKGEAAKAFNALAEGLAIVSFCPGGVKFCGLHWETKE